MPNDKPNPDASMDDDGASYSDPAAPGEADVSQHPGDAAAMGSNEDLTGDADVDAEAGADDIGTADRNPGANRARKPQDRP